jgi:hypothetical protein
VKKAGRSPRSPEQARIAELERKLGKAEAESARKDEVLAEIQSHPAHVLDPLFDHVTERGGDEVLPGREVVLCGAPGDAGGGGCQGTLGSPCGRSVHLPARGQLISLCAVS